MVTCAVTTILKPIFHQCESSIAFNEIQGAVTEEAVKLLLRYCAVTWEVSTTCVLSPVEVLFHQLPVLI